MIRSARSPSTASMALGACFRSESSPTGQYGAGWNGVVRDDMVKLYGSDGVRGLLYGDFSQFIMQALDAGVGDRFWFRHGFRLVQNQRPDYADPSSKEVEIEGLDVAGVGIPGYTVMPKP